MNLEVPMSSFVCRWCGSPYSIAAALADNPSFTKRCPLGHKNSDGTTLETSLANTKRYLDELEKRNAGLLVTIRNLKGQITKLKTARP